MLTSQFRFDGRTGRASGWLIAWVAAVVLVTAGAGTAEAAADPLLDQQWHLATVGAPHAWDVTMGAGTTVAVVDSGVDLDHEDLAERIGSGTTCLATNNDPGACSGSPDDDNGHGTHVSGIALATAGNGVGVAGVAPRATLMPVRALQQACQTAVNASGGETCVATGNSADTGAAIRWAVDHGADIVNLSLGEPIALRVEPGTQLGDEIEYAWSKGVIVVGAAGNDFDVAVGSHYGTLPLVVVTATGPDDRKAAYSNTVGEVRWGVAAPGGAGTGDCPSAEILSTTWQVTGENDTYGCMAGTSMAAPVVSGALALLLASGLSPEQAIDRLLGTADDIGPEGVDTQFGHGLINVARALGSGQRSAGSGDAGDAGDSGGGAGGGSAGDSVERARPAPGSDAGDAGMPSTGTSDAERVTDGTPAEPRTPPRPDRELETGLPSTTPTSNTSAVRTVGVALAIAFLALDAALFFWSHRRWAENSPG